MPTSTHNDYLPTPAEAISAKIRAEAISAKIRAEAISAKIRAEAISAKIRAEVALAESVKSFDPFALLTDVLDAEFKRLEDEREAQLAHHEQGRINKVADFGWLMHELGLVHPDRVITDTVLTVNEVRFALDMHTIDDEDEGVEYPVLNVKLLDRVKPFNVKEFKLLSKVSSELWGEVQYRLVREETRTYEERILNPRPIPAEFWAALKLEVATFLYRSNVITRSTAEGEV